MRWARVVRSAAQINGLPNCRTCAFEIFGIAVALVRSLGQAALHSCQGRSRNECKELTAGGSPQHRDRAIEILGVSSEIVAIGKRDREVVEGGQTGASRQIFESQDCRPSAYRAQVLGPTVECRSDSTVLGLANKLPESLAGSHVNPEVILGLGSVNYWADRLQSGRDQRPPGLLPPGSAMLWRRQAQIRG